MRPTNVAAAFFSLAFIVGCSKSKKEVVAPAPAPAVAEVKPEPKPQPKPVTKPEPAKPATPPATLAEIIYFEFDSAQLDAQARERLNENARWLKEDPTRTLTIEGHTDEEGTAEYNLGLGERRAISARDYLVRLGIRESRIRVITFGEERPASEANEKNRRSVFVASRK